MSEQNTELGRLLAIYRNRVEASVLALLQAKANPTDRLTRRNLERCEAQETAARENIEVYVRGIDRQ